MESSSYKLLNIILVESQFKREPEINYDSEDFKSDIKINIENQKKENKLFITLTIDFKAGISTIEQIFSKIKMLGIFEYSNSDIVSVDDFAQINGPAIIFPFIREHLATLSLKAGINPILLPPINFVKLSKKENTSKGN